MTFLGLARVYFEIDHLPGQYSYHASRFRVHRARSPEEYRSKEIYFNHNITIWGKGKPFSFNQGRGTGKGGAPKLEDLAKFAFKNKVIARKRFFAKVQTRTQRFV